MQVIIITIKVYVIFHLQASANGHEEIVKYLIDKGADINHKDNQGRTALIKGIHQDELLKCCYFLMLYLYSSLHE